MAHTNNVAKVFQSLLLTARIWEQSNCLPLPVLACSQCHGHSLLTPFFGRSLGIGFAIAGATAWQTSSHCRHRRRRPSRYSCRQACLPTSIIFFSPTKFTISPTFVAFSPSGVSFSPSGVSYSPDSTFASLRQSS